MTINQDEAPNLPRGGGSIEYKNDRQEVHTELAQGGWDVYYGDIIELWEVAIGLLGSVISDGVSVPAWVEWQISTQIAKFGQSLGDINGDIVQKAIELLVHVIESGQSGEWNISGLGIKAGIATYHYWFRVKYPWGGHSGWNVLPSNFQPYIGFRLTEKLPPQLGLGEVVAKPIEPPVSLASTHPIAPTP
jgi:hypothetical protein